MKHIILILVILFTAFSYGQKKIDTDLMRQTGYQKLKNGEEVLNFTKPFNIFIATGISYRTGTNYGVTISPIDNTVQFQEKPNLHSGISTGLVWTPIIGLYEVYNKDENKWQYEERNNGFSIALLINIFNLSFSGEQVNSTSPINVGLGLGWKKNDFLILATYEFTPLRQPRNYFIDGYKGQNKTLLISGTQEPVKTININDDSLFYTKLYQFFGIKIAYSFSSKKTNL